LDLTLVSIKNFSEILSSRSWGLGSDRFTHRSWPRAPHNSFLWWLNFN